MNLTKVYNLPLIYFHHGAPDTDEVYLNNLFVPTIVLEDLGCSNSRQYLKRMQAKREELFGIYTLSQDHIGLLSDKFGWSSKVRRVMVVNLVNLIKYLPTNKNNSKISGLLDVERCLLTCENCDVNKFKYVVPLLVPGQKE